MEKQGRSVNTVVNKILSPFGVFYNQQNKVQHNKNELLQNYNRQYNNYMKRFPNNPHNVRFTQ